MAKQMKVTRPIRAEDVYVRITCPLCGKNFRFSAANVGKYKVCRCARIGFKVIVEPMPGYIRVSVEGLDYAQRAYLIEPEELELDED